MGEPQGFREFISVLSPALYRRAILLTHDRIQASQLVNATVSTLLPGWTRAPEHRELWAFVVEYRRFIKQASRPGALNAPQLKPGNQQGKPPTESRDEIALANQLIMHTPAERALAVHCLLDQVTTHEAAANLGLNSEWAAQAMDKIAPETVMKREGG